MSFETTPEQRADFAAELGIQDLALPCPLTDGSAAAAVYYWPLLRYADECHAGLRLAFPSGLVCASIGEDDMFYSRDEIIRSIINAIMVNGYCTDLIETLTIGADEDPLDIARES